MSVIRTGVFLLVLSWLAACTSAEIPARAVRNPQPGPASAQEPVAPGRAAPAMIGRPIVTVPVVPLPRAPAASVPPPPVPITRCDPGGCWSGGVRYEGGAGGTYLDKDGRLCQGNGAWMQCF